MAGIIGQIVYNVSGVPNTDKVNKDMLEKGIIGPERIIPSNGVITKLGIQAQPGTKVLLSPANNSEISIIIGRTGIYELDERIKISQLKIIPTPKFQYNETATKAAQNNALSAFKALDDTAYPENGVWGDNLDIWVSDYQNNINDFNLGYIEYLKGKHGIYDFKKDAEGNVEKEDIYNLIIDYIYEIAS